MAGVRFIEDLGRLGLGIIYTDQPPAIIITFLFWNLVIAW